MSSSTAIYISSNDITSDKDHAFSVTMNSFTERDFSLPVLKRLHRHNNTLSSTYFIGCSNWQYQEKCHRYISINENIDCNLLQQLLDETYEGESNEPVNNCYTVLHNSSKKTHCHKLINNKFIYYTGIHLHPPPPPNRVPDTIRNCLQELIYQANDNTSNVTSTHIITENLIKSYFGTEYLANIHASLNKIDHLRYYINKIQKEIHPRGQGLLGVIYNYSRNINNICDYIKRLEFFEDQHILIICTTSEQLNEWMKCEYFQIDLSFKPDSEDAINKLFDNIQLLDENLKG
ncbi:23048_t:CDS:2 [Gigaspora rosea]|nr:23048_t:CDS:2 [Gigaspora rosea]